MAIDVTQILITEKDGSITASHKGSAVSVGETKRIWFDCNCPFCRRHWLDNLEDYQNAIVADELVLVMTPLAFLTQYSAQAGALLLGIAPYGAELFFDVFKAEIFHGIGESEGNDEGAVANKINEVYEAIIVPGLAAIGVSADTFRAAISETAFDQIQANTQGAIDRGITGVPHIETL